MIAIGEASRQSGVSIETIRYYEREGIISKVGRTASGRRLYSKKAIAELCFVKRCRDLGFSIQHAIALKELTQEAGDTCQSAAEVGQKHLSEVQAKIEELRRLESALLELVGNCAEGRRDCPMLEALMTQN